MRYASMAKLTLLCFSALFTWLLCAAAVPWVNLAANACSAWDGMDVTPPFHKQGEHAYNVHLPKYDHLSDTLTASTRSPVRLCEDGKMMGPPHASHAEIREKGAGRYSLWTGGWLYFSASDVTDPNTNGRRYRVVTPPWYWVLIPH